MFDLELSKEQKMIKDEVAKLVKDLVTEQAKEWDMSGDTPMGTIQKAWELGASVSAVPEEFGGFGMDDSPITTAIILEELSNAAMGFSRKHLLEKWMRDVKITNIYDGTQQIQSLIVARQILGLKRDQLK